MPKLLHIDSSSLYGISVSRELTASLVAHWKTVHVDGTVVVRDLNVTSISTGHSRRRFHTRSPTQ